MKIIITESFDKKYILKFKRYFSSDEFVGKLTKTSIIHLKHPYFKIKIRLRMVEFRGVALLQQGDYLIPLLVSLKKDKKYGENIIWTEFEKQILDAQKIARQDIESKKYKVY